MATPSVGKKSNEATIDQANQAMRAMPWWTDLMTSMGQNPNNVKLTHAQSQKVFDAARAHGFAIDPDGMHVDESGNIDKKGHAVRNTLIVVGIAAATIATMGAAGAFSGAAATGMAGGAAGAGASGLGGAGAAGLGAGTVFGGTATGGALIGGGGAVVGGGLGATSMLGTGALAGGLNAGLSAGATGVGAGLPGAMATMPAYSGAAASGAAGGGGGAFNAAGQFIGDSTYTVPGATSNGLTSMATRYGLNYGSQLAGNYIQARASGKAADAQQAYLQQALDYEKEKDAYARSTDAEQTAYSRKTADEARALEAQRYGDREGRLAPYRANGVSANSSMASFLGLPAPAAALPAPRPLPVSAAPVQAAAVQPERVAVVDPAAAPIAAPAAAPVALVTMRAPDGRTKQVPPDQVAHYQELGAEVVSA